MVTFSGIYTIYAPGPSGQTEGPYNSNWLGDGIIDAEFEKLHFPYTSINATSIEFDFISLSNKLLLDFVVASNEHEINRSSFTDYLSIVLTDLELGKEKNIATSNSDNIPYIIRGINWLNNANYFKNKTDKLFTDLNIINDNTKNITPSNYTFWLNNRGDFHSNYLNSTNYYGLEIPVKLNENIIPGKKYHLDLLT